MLQGHHWLQPESLATVGSLFCVEIVMSLICLSKQYVGNAYAGDGAVRSAALVTTRFHLGVFIKTFIKKVSII